MSIVARYDAIGSGAFHFQVDVPPAVGAAKEAVGGDLEAAWNGDVEGVGGLVARVVVDGEPRGRNLRLARDRDAVLGGGMKPAGIPKPGISNSTGTPS